jgi:PIN domain nuclease of toxin-antitoxin system
MIYVPDTHALVWYLTADKQLGKQAKAALASVDAGRHQAVIPVIVLAEIMYLEEHGRIQVKLNVLLEYLRSIPTYTIASLTLDTVLIAKTITGVPELFDRMIVATALEHRAFLLSRDPVFRNVRDVQIVW